MSSMDADARKSLQHLVGYVFQHRDGLINGMTYTELAFAIGRLKHNGEGHGHGMGNVLGAMGRLLQGLEGEWKEPIPHIQCLVVNKAGTRRGLPDDGIKEFWPEYPSLTRPAKESRVRIEQQKIVSFGSRWNDVLKKLGLEPISAATAVVNKSGWGGAGGESESHKRLKNFVREHPEIVGASDSWESFVEYPLPSLDEIDVVFMSKESCIAVEAKSKVSDAYPDDYLRGLYQVIKYGSLLAAMNKDGRYGVPNQIRSLLVLESQLPPDIRGIAARLNVEVIENVVVPA